MALLKAVPYQQQSRPSFRSAPRIAGLGLDKCRRSCWGLHCHSTRNIRKVEFSKGSCCTDLFRSLPRGLRARAVVCSATQCPLPARAKDIFQALAVAATRMVDELGTSPATLKSAPAAAVLLFSAYGLVPFMRLVWKSFLKKDRSWEKSQMKHVIVSYVRPLLFWMGTISICRSVDPIVLSSAASQVIKDRMVNFVRSLSTVLAFAVCTTNLTQEVQRSVEKLDPDKARDVGVQFIGSAVSTSVWVAAACLFMELLGFSTQKLITAGGFGTVLVTLAGREILTNFLSSIMIHATRPFVENQWIQTKIEGQEISGTVEHVGWWSPTVIRGDDREAVHIPNHKFSVTVVRNLSQKTHWRVKTYLAISHLDVGKLNPIIADMRKVLAKQPQVEQKRLHRRVFLDYVDPENQSLVVMVSCFVKTSRFEEYLRVKELILLDLLRVVGHHNARLATPIRSVQRVPPDDFQPASSYKYERPLLLPGSSVLSSKPSEVVNDSRQSSSTTAVEETAGNMETFDSVRNPTRKDEAAGPKTNDFDADDLVEKGSQTKPRKIFVQEHAEEQIVGSIMASGEKKPPSASEDIIVLEGRRESSSSQSSRDKTS